MKVSRLKHRSIKGIVFQYECDECFVIRVFVNTRAAMQYTCYSTVEGGVPVCFVFAYIVGQSLIGVGPSTILRLLKCKKS
jgi:hypothetical protein